MPLAQQPRAISYRNPLSRYTPKRVNERSRWRFVRHRRVELIQRIGGEAPDERQRLAIDMLIQSEWAGIVAEVEAAAAADAKSRVLAMRIAADARKQVLLWHRELSARGCRHAPNRPLADLARNLLYLLSLFVEAAANKQKRPIARQNVREDVAACFE